MPFMNGKRVTPGEWRAAHPRPTLYGYDRNGVRFVRYDGAPPQAEPVTAAIGPVARGVEARTDAVRAAVADAMGLNPEDLVVPDIALPTNGAARQNEAGGLIDLAGEVPAAEPLAESPRGDRNRREVEATLFSLAKGLPRHRRVRRSQTPEGRRERYIRQKADRLGVTFPIAARMTRRNQTRQTERTSDH